MAASNFPRMTRNLISTVVSYCKRTEEQEKRLTTWSLKRTTGCVTNSGTVTVYFCLSFPAFTPSLEFFCIYHLVFILSYLPFSLSSAMLH